MKRLLLALSVAAAVTVNAVPMPVQAASLPVVSANYAVLLAAGSFGNRWVAIRVNEAGKEALKILLEKCGVDWIPTVPKPPQPEESEPENPETQPPETEAPETEAPETQAPEIQAPETEAPETQAPETKPPVTVQPETKPPVTVPEESKPEETGPEETTPETSSPGEDETDIHPYVLRIVELVNEERAKAGLSMVTLDTKATEAAQIRAQEIVSSFSHTRPDGTKFTTALKEQGITYRQAGENIAWGQRSPEAVMEAWMNSSGHRANILKSAFTHIGIGYYEENGVKYWSQLFYSN